MRASRLKQLTAWLAVWRNRSLLLLVVHLIGWLMLGRAVLLPFIPGDDTIQLDRWIRAGVFAVLEPRDTLAVTYVDIDDALYRDRWGLPAMTPRDELARLVDSLASAGARLIVVDVDLAWGERDAVLGEFLASYDAEAPLVFMRQIVEDTAGLVLYPSAYDDVFAANPRLRWAHAFFFTSAGGQIVDWAPWVAACGGAGPELLPAVAVVAFEQSRGAEPARPPTPAGCSTDHQPATQRIIYTEGFGFPRSSRIAAGEVFNVERRAARTLRAEALLDGSRIDTAALLRGRIAIIGGSHAAGRDLHDTPIGVLPGAVVQANTVIHALPQLRAAEASASAQRVAVAGLFTLLALLSLPVASVLAAVTAVLLLSLGASYQTFTTVELALLLFVQFKFMTWLVEPFWKPLRADGWQTVLPKYLRKKKDK